MTNRHDSRAVETWMPPRLLEWLRWPDLGAFGQTMRAEEYREGNDLVVRLEIPGLDPDKDVDVHVEDHALRITARREQQETVDDRHGYRSEFQYGSFSRVMSLPPGAKEDDVKATYKDGILEVRVHFDEHAATTSRIEVQRI